MILLDSFISQLLVFYSLNPGSVNCGSRAKCGPQSQNSRPASCLTAKNVDNTNRVVRSLPPNPVVPGSIPGLIEGWIFGWSFFPLFSFLVHSAFHPSGVGKMSNLIKYRYEMLNRFLFESIEQNYWINLRIHDTYFNFQINFPWRSYILLIVIRRVRLLKPGHCY